MLQSCLTLCDPVDHSLSGSSVHGISKARMLEWVATSFSRRSFQARDLPNSGIKPVSPTLRKDPLPLSHHSSLISRKALLTKEKQTVHSQSKVTQLCPTLCDPMDCSLPGSSVHGIFQARVLEWVAISCSRRSSRPRDQTQVSHIAERRFTI